MIPYNIERFPQILSVSNGLNFKWFEFQMVWNSNHLNHSILGGTTQYYMESLNLPYVEWFPIILRGSPLYWVFQMVWISNGLKFKQFEPLNIRRNHSIRLKFKPIQIRTDSNSNRFKFKPIQIQTDSNSNRFKFKPIQFQTDSNSNRFKFKPIQIQTDSNSNRFKFKPIQIQTDSSSN